MIHQPTSHDEFYGVSNNDQFVLVQLQDQLGEQVRVRLTPDEAKHMATLLSLFIQRVKQQPVDFKASIT